MRKLKTDRVLVKRENFSILKRFGNISKFGDWEIIDYAGHENNKTDYWTCKCAKDGTIRLVNAFHLLDGSSKNCGCASINRLGDLTRTHGMSHTRLNGIWQHMMQRCLNPNNSRYEDYGGSDITVCPEWQTFEGFYKDVGESYNKHVIEFGVKETTLDRFPNQTGNYEPGNVRWATYREQAQNTKSSVTSENYKQHEYYRHKFEADLYQAIIKNKTTPFFLHYVGLTSDEFKKYIESLWLPDMNWGNRGRCNKKKKVWQIDHCKAKHHFDLSKEKDRLECFNYKNLQPLWWQDNNYKR